MKFDLETIATLERVNYLTMQPMAQLMQGLEVIIRPDIIFTSSETYPSPDANHACLVRSDPPRVDALIDEVISFFSARGMPPVVLVSPACQPENLAERLTARGFQKQEPNETWMVFDGLQKFKMPTFLPDAQVRKIERTDAPLFAEVMVASYGMPEEWKSVLADMIAPSIGAPGVTHFIAFKNNQPIATLTLARYENYVTIGSAGVLPEYRGGRTIYNMAVETLTEAKRQGADIILLQTSLGATFERFLRIYGFKFAFQRETYLLA